MVTFQQGVLKVPGVSPLVNVAGGSDEGQFRLVSLPALG